MSKQASALVLAVFVPLILSQQNALDSLDYFTAVARMATSRHLCTDLR